MTRPFENVSHNTPSANRAKKKKQGETTRDPGGVRAEEARGTHLQQTIPASSAQRHTVRADAQARHPILVARQHAYALSLEHVPHVAVVVVVPGEEQPAGHGERYGRDTAEDVVVYVGVEFAIRSEVEETA